MTPMKRGDVVKCKGKEEAIIGLLMSVDSPSSIFWDEYVPKKITVIDFDGNKHRVELWSVKDIELLKI